jgi:hypothetical protein
MDAIVCFFNLLTLIKHGTINQQQRGGFMANTISAVPENGDRNVLVFPLQSNKYYNVLTRTIQ